MDENERITLAEPIGGNLRLHSHYDRGDSVALCMKLPPERKMLLTTDLLAVNCKLCLKIIRTCVTHGELKQLCVDRSRTDHERTAHAKRIKAYHQGYRRRPVHHFARDTDLTECGLTIKDETRLWDGRQGPRLCSNCVQRRIRRVQIRQEEAEDVALFYRVQDYLKQEQSNEGEKSEGNQTVQ